MSACREGLSALAFRAGVKAADLAIQVPMLRGYLLERLMERVQSTYDQCESDTYVLEHVKWFGRHLQPFLQRLLKERPAAARAILRFLATWASDLRRRTDRQQAGRVGPCTVVIEPTDRCNLACPGCYAKSTNDGSDLSYEQFCGIADQVIDMGVTLLTISGGEPFLREKSEQMLTRLAMRHQDRGFLVYTNGTMIDEDIADRLAAVGNIFPAISVEGFEHQTNRRRGSGVYEQNRRVRRMLADRGVMCGFSATMTRENAESICSDEFIEMRIAEGDLFGWFFLLQPIGRSPRPDLMVTADQRALMRETIYRWRAEDRPIFMGDFWNDGHLSGGCIGGRYYFHIYANGDISPCVFAPVAGENILEIIAGRSEYRNLDDYVQRSDLFKAYRREQEGVTDRNRPCMLIDNPQAFQRIRCSENCRPAKNFPPGYADGEIAEVITQVAQEWQEKCTQLPPVIKK
ncbi:MAG: radical SAM/SPASM domain-containing protein [Planctomycetaceae bacterium]|nr:radical SAM protein [Planctomycetaceae bacterium]